MSQLINKIELSFWDITIPLISESVFVRSSLKKFIEASQSKLLMGSLFILAWGGLGLMTGYALSHYELIH